MSGKVQVQRFTCKKGLFKWAVQPDHPYCNGCKHLEKTVRCPDFAEKEDE